MKNILTKYSGLCLAALLVTGACTDNFEEINTDPTAYNSATFDPNYMLTTSQLTYTGSTDFAFETWRANLIHLGPMMQGISTTVSYWAGDKYLLNEAYLAAYWERAYSEQVKVVTDIVETTRDREGFNNIHQAARIMRALSMHRITDLYGDIPYFEAGLGYYTGIITPAYDSQQAIYEDLLKEVEEATNALDPNGDPLTGDVMLDGDINKWKRFGNSLLLRIAMRLSKVDPQTAQEYVAKVQGNTMQSNEDNARIAHDETGGRTTQNRNSQVLLGDGGQEHYYTKWSDTFINFLQENDDPRLSEVAASGLYLDPNDKAQSPDFSTDPADQKGMPNGLSTTPPAPEFDVNEHPSFTEFSDYSSIHPAMTQRDGYTFVMTYAESELLLADAAERWGIGNAESHYNNGVRAAMTYLSQYDPEIGVSEDEADNYLAANPYVKANGLEMINTQYWVHTNTMLDFYESWANWRRTGYPELTPVVFPGNATSGTIPRRFVYPLSEASANPDNYAEAHANYPGGDLLTSRVWWDVAE